MVGSTQAGDVTLAVAIRRYFDVLLFLLIFTGFGTLASTGRLDLPTVVVVTVALLYRGYVIARRRQVLLSERWTNLLTIGCVAFFVADEFFISRTFISATVHLILFVMLVRLFSAQRDRDHYLLAVLSFLMVLAAAVLTVDSTFLLALCAFVLVAVAAFILMEMMHSVQRSPVLARDPSVHHAYRKLSFTVLGIAPVLLLLIFMVGGVIFFLLPRVSAGYLSGYTGGNDLTAGFSDKVELGRIGEIQRSKTAVMHVQIGGDSVGAFSLKLRGMALDHFDGHSWSNTRNKVTLTRDSAGRFNLALHNSPPPAANSQTLHYRVTTEPLLNSVFFLLANTHWLEGNYRAISEDTAADVFNLDSERPVSRYQADSELRHANKSVLHARSGTYPPDVFASYLQLPALDSRIAALANQVTAKSSSPYEKAVALENYLRLHYGYTLQLPAATPRDPVADFLFVRHQGHCEYFASALAIMLRDIGIPSRVVNGFSGGEFNDINSQYLIRASDAHSWVEAYFPGEGWMEFDATPPAIAPAQTQWSRLMLYMDAMASFWREWVVNYDLGHQLQLTQDTSRGTRAMLGNAQSWGRNKYDHILAWARKIEDRIGRSTVKWGLRVVFLILLAILLISTPRLVFMIQRWRLARRPQKSPQMAASIWYSRMLHLTAKRGWQKSATQTPEEFTASISDPLLKERISGFTEHYENARFGRSKDDVSRLPELYEEIKTSR